MARHLTASDQRIAFYLRSPRNLHYFACLKPYLDAFLAEGGREIHLVVRRGLAEAETLPDYNGYRELFTDEHDLDRYDLVITPTFLRSDERTSRTRAVQIFHGMSDKSFTYERDFSDYLLCLCSGRKQVDRLLQYPHNRWIRWRLVGYPKFDHPETGPRVFDNARKTAVYCPTWRKGGLSSIERVLARPEVLASITDAYNLIIKPHPNLLDPDRDFYEPAIVERLNRLPGVYLARTGNVMPWFARADLFLGDISATGYEWLYFDRPMIFVNPQPGSLEPSTDYRQATYLWQCGEVCDDLARLRELIDQAFETDAHHAARERVLHYAVHQPRQHGATRRGLYYLHELLAAGPGAGARRSRR